MFFISKLVFKPFVPMTGLLSSLSYMLLLFSFSSLAKGYHSDAEATPAITWKRPTSGDMFQSGDALAVEWITDSDIVSPSIGLCEVSTDTRRRRSHREADKRHHRPNRRDSNCGASIWPEVQKTSNGSQLVNFELPNVAESRSYYLLMEDNFGSLMRSPPFSVPHSSSDATSTDVADTASESTSYTDELGPTNPPTAQAPLSRANAMPSHSILSSTAKPTASIPKGPIYVDSNNLLTQNHPPPTAAIAIPLVAAAAALLIAGGLAIRHRRTLRKERERDKMTIRVLDKLRKSDTLTSSSSSTHPTLPPQLPPLCIQPVPLFMPMPMPVEYASDSGTRRVSTLSYPGTGEARQSTRQAFRYQSPLSLPASGGYNHSVSSDMSSTHPPGLSTPTSSGRSRSRRLPAMDPYTSSSSLLAPCLPPLSFSHPMTKEGSSSSPNCTTSNVLEDYCLPSPHLGLASHDPFGQNSTPPLRTYPVKPPSLPQSLLSAPQRLHIRDEAPTSVPVPPYAIHESEERQPSRMPTPVRNLYREQRDAYAAITSLLGKS